MPKGVEHTVATALEALDTNPPTSVMPKGVEHILEAVHDDTLSIPPTSVMPKGVEHRIPPVPVVVPPVRPPL